MLEYRGSIGTHITLPENKVTIDYQSQDGRNDQQPQSAGHNSLSNQQT